MKFSLTQSGGWANVAFGSVIDTTLCSQAKRERLEHLVEAVLATASPQPGILRGAPMRMPDALRYRLIVETPSGPRRIEGGDGDKSEALRELVDLLRPEFRPLPSGPHQPLR